MPFRLLAVVLLFLSLPAGATEWTGRFSLLGNVADPAAGDIGSGGKSLLADQQSLRLMLDDTEESSEWSVHLKSIRQNLTRYPDVTRHSSDLFRFRPYAGSWSESATAQHTTRIGYEFDRFYYKQRFAGMTLSVGRQPVDWGSGRFWQPLNVFGAFAPTDLDTDYKPGIDAAVLDWFPSAFSSLTAVYVPRPQQRPDLKSSGVLHYRTQLGEAADMVLLAGTVLGHELAGGSLEGDFSGIGWRLEGLFDRTNNHPFFWIAGLEYQFGDGTLVEAEWYDNSAGATKESELPARFADVQVAYGLQQHLGRQVGGIALSREITPLLQGSYSFLIAGLKDARNRWVSSLLHQASLTYSVSNESDLLGSVIIANGKGLSPFGLPQSEFGHLPASFMLRYRIYF